MSERLLRFWRLWLYNFGLSAFLFLAFYLAARPASPLFFIGSALGTAATLYLLLALLLRPLLRFGNWVNGVLIALIGLADFALLVDFFIFRLWKFHINAMVLNILTSPAAFESIEIGRDVYAVAGGFWLIFLLWQIFLWRKRLPLPPLKPLITALIALIMAEKITYGIAVIQADAAIIESAKAVPLYQPLTFTKLARKLFGIEKKSLKNPKLATGVKAVRYPLAPITLQNPRTPPIFFILLDALRADQVDPKVTPNLWRLTRESLFYPNNRSGGNTTRFGFFSLMYGLNAPYWFSFLNSRTPPVLFDVLKRLDYQIGIFVSTDTRWPEFHETVFKEVLDHITDRMQGFPWEKDRDLTERWKAWMREQNLSKPLFSLIFFDGPHGMEYPINIAPFKPDGLGTVRYTTATPKDRIEVLNKYKNAIHYDDILLGWIFQRLKELHLYDKAIIIVTSDHGQEFFEHGFLGHNSAFDLEQTNSPVIIKLPHAAKRGRVDRLSSSIDLVPSLLRYLGVANDFDDYANALSDMFSPQTYRRDFATSGGWYKNAVITPRYTLVFSNLPNEIFSAKAYDPITHTPLPYPKNDPKIQQIILKVLAQNRRFLQ